MRAIDLKLMADHIIEKMGDNAEITMLKEGARHELDFLVNYRNDGDLVKPKVVEDGVTVMPGVKLKA